MWTYVLCQYFGAISLDVQFIIVVALMIIAKNHAIAILAPSNVCWLQTMSRWVVTTTYDAIHLKRNNFQGIVKNLQANSIFKLIKIRIGWFLLTFWSECSFWWFLYYCHTDGGVERTRNNQTESNHALLLSNWQKMYLTCLMTACRRCCQPYWKDAIWVGNQQRRSCIVFNFSKPWYLISKIIRGEIENKEPL